MGEAVCHDIRVVLSEQRIRSRTRNLAREIKERMGNTVHCVVVLNGAVVFFVDLMRKLSALGVSISFSSLKVSSYIDGMSSGKVAKELFIKPGSLLGRDIMVVEDMIDTGLTMRYVTEYLRRKGVSSVRSCVLIAKLFRPKIPVEPAFVGFILDERFIVGHGMVYSDWYHELPFVGSIAFPKGRDRYGCLPAA